MRKSVGLHHIEEGSFVSNFPKRTHIYFKNYLPPKRKLAKHCFHVIFQHGMIEYQNRHLDFFNFLREQLGNKVFISAMDLYGHGKSGGDRGYIDNFETFVQDYKAFIDICYHRFYQKENNITPIFVSHSLGGLILLKFLADDTREININPSACVFVNPCLKPKLELPKEVIHFAGKLPEPLLQVRVPLIYDAYDLSHDHIKAEEFIHDQLISKSITLKLGLETLLATKDINSVSYFFNFPSLFLVSGDDRVVESSRIDLFCTGMGKQNVEKRNYPKMRHDLLNETCRFEVFEEIIRYIKALE